MQFRIVRFQLDNGNFECAAANLSKDEFPPEKLKVLYARNQNAVRKRNLFCLKNSKIFLQDFLVAKIFIHLVAEPVIFL